MMPLMGNYTAIVTREAGRNSWLLRILTEDKNQQSREALPHNQRQMEAAAGASECLRKLNQMSHNSALISTRLQCPGRTKAARTQRAVQDKKPLSSITRRARKQPFTPRRLSKEGGGQ